MRRKRGCFTILEALSVIFIFSLVVVAMIVGIPTWINSGKETATKNTIRDIKKAMELFSDDTHNPVGKRSYDIIRSSSGTNPTYAGDSGTTVWGIASASVDTISIHLITNGAGYTAYNANGDGLGWRSAYLNYDPIDKWNHNIWIGVVGFKTAGSVWICSAGANGVLDTAPTAISSTGDDICERVQ